MPESVSDGSTGKRRRPGRVWLAVLSIGAGVAAASTPAVAQSVKMKPEDCPGEMRLGECVMSTDQYDNYVRRRTTDENRRRDEEYDARQRAYAAEARARYNHHTLSGAAEVMRRRREGAAANGN